MQIILLSGGSGTRLWPLSNDARSKQFLKLLPKSGSDEPESMVQRVVRQIRETQIDASITIATSVTQQDSIISQLGNMVNIVTEPSRRDTFPAICLACEYLSKERNIPDDEVVVVMPCDPYTEEGYFDTVVKMCNCVSCDIAELLLMGIKPTNPSPKYGYILPGKALIDGVLSVDSFKEKPTTEKAKELVSKGALWNGGVFAFKLGYVKAIAKKYVCFTSFTEILKNYSDYPKISFDYEVVENARSVGVLPFSGKWKDLGTWNALTDELKYHNYGNVTVAVPGKNTHIINELDIPILCMGTEDMIIAASPDGILISDKSKSEYIKDYANKLKRRPMYEERRWGVYKVIDYVEYPDGHCALTKHLRLNPGASISYQKHTFRDEVWTFIDGEGEIILNDIRKPVYRGMTIEIPKGFKHAVRAITSLSFIEVQSGKNLVESDIIRYHIDW